MPPRAGTQDALVQFPVPSQCSCSGSNKLISQAGIYFNPGLSCSQHAEVPYSASGFWILWRAAQHLALAEYIYLFIFWSFLINWSVLLAVLFSCFEFTLIYGCLLSCVADQNSQLRKDIGGLCTCMLAAFPKHWAMGCSVGGVRKDVQPCPCPGLDRV